MATATATTPQTDGLSVGEHTLPASWWTSPEIYEVEKRAIFFKSWMFIVHESRLTKPGDYLSYTIAGLNFFVIKNKAGQVNAFHNVCRHRAYPVVKKEQGSALVLGCRYHGWSYNTDGNLTKAPHFDNVQGFDKAQNGLYPIRTHTTDQGLVFLSFDATEEGPMPFDEWFKGLQTEMHEYDFSDYEYHMSYELDGQFNWKTLMDGYQECYHCPTAHPGLSKAFKMPTYKVVPKDRWCRHYAQIIKPDELPTKKPAAAPATQESSGWFGFGNKPEAAAAPAPADDKVTNRGGSFDGLWMYLFPTNGINCYSPAWYSIRVVPITPTRTILQYDIYKKKGIEQAEIDDFVEFLQQVEIEDFDLCEATQKNLNTGVYSTGFLHPEKERGVLFYQNMVRDLVVSHLEKEEKAGQQINVAKIGSASTEGQKLEGICKSLQCTSEAAKSEVLAW
ncbi:hypothetical protein DV451_003565 [Geotrichum candidum]|uniref:Choline monooxygenase, chloroplastic n=1 Tax=Geotrichum candidum TaxID=1173061 RepID=A0A9P5G3R3_GEOCN|nr:hypothetical protein DV451_003565 [Geotrichum candidum]KAF5107256.1 hypothetical protein DV453_003219 [Geotrichum candidum]